ncbi:hypothetical protein EX30DRAFT_395783 [Ascodesmis nigricans]|uniref:Uncharacterized protein n=1 Tax=Ascodesmis nigricans TaxID=341454 RepID=A0A4S2MXJ9_9PEZI|nr:hypothetical protein EX30DRAFT_395783 [Ascodesmis nigricans]
MARHGNNDNHGSTTTSHPPHQQQQQQKRQEPHRVQTLKRGWTLIEKPPLSTGWEKLEPPSQEHVEADEELRRLVGNESILEFVKSWIEVATGLKARNFSGEGALMR